MRSRPHMIAMLAGIAAVLGTTIEVRYEEPEPRRPDPPPGNDPLKRTRRLSIFNDDPAPTKPPTNGAREVARRLRQMERAAAKAGRRKPE